MKMKTTEEIAIEVLRCALACEPHVMLVGNVSANEMAQLAASRITGCPKCGATAWCNIDCDLCSMGSAFREQGNAPVRTEKSQGGEG